ncbi:carbon storage regulator [Novilysobacter arseniciresistens]|uniref:carbon storage regulator n=1 Tax=Novilysobacter arseniciresistens TaxID=1385522 RepID=UPI000A5EC6EB
MSVGSSVRVTVLSVRDGQVKLGIAAPRDVPVHRDEIFRRMLREAEGNAVAPLSVVTKSAPQG